MKKKILSGAIVTLASAASIVLLAGCGGAADTSSTTAESTHVSETETSTSGKETSASASTSETASSSETETSSGTASESEGSTTTAADSLSPIDNGKVASESIQIDIKGYKVFPAGTGGAKNSLNPVVVFYYDASNLSDKEIDALSAWTEIFDAYQNTGENDRNMLGTGIFADESVPAEDGTTPMKKGETKSYYKSYELTDGTSSVTLKSHDGLGGARLGDDIVIRVMS